MQRGACLALFTSDPASAPACAGAAAGRGAAFGRGGGRRHPEHLGAVASCAGAVWHAAPACIGLPGRPAVAGRSWRTRERGRAAGRPVHGEADRQWPDLHADVRREAGSTDEVTGSRYRTCWQREKVAAQQGEQARRAARHFDWTRAFSSSNQFRTTRSSRGVDGPGVDVPAAAPRIRPSGMRSKPRGVIGPETPNPRGSAVGSENVNPDCVETVTTAS